jgi:hypothetical protein
LFLWPQAALAVPAGLLAASLGRGPDLTAPEFTAAARRRELAARKAADRAAATGTELEVAALAVSIAGDLPGDWRQGKYLVLPGRSRGCPGWSSAGPGRARASTSPARPTWPPWPPDGPR